MALPDIPPFDPQFTQIPLGRNLLPLDDLQAAGGYDRQLILPDDVPPVLSQGWTQGPVKPRLITGQDDGSVNVHVTGGAAGGGFISTNWQAFSFQEEHRDPGGFADSFNLGTMDQTWYLVEANLTVSVAVADPPPLSGVCTVNVELHQVVTVATQYFLSCSLAYDAATLHLGALTASSCFNPAAPLQLPVFVPAGSVKLGVEYDTTFPFWYTLNASFCQKQ